MTRRENERRELEQPGARRFGPTSQPFLGVEGSFEAEREGKIWLNDINLVGQMGLEYMILELRRQAHAMAGTWDEIPVAWPAILEEEPAGNPSQRVDLRLKRFIDIFSARDHRFAVLPDNLPGGGLERRLAEYLDLSLEDESWTDEMGWSYPIDPKAPHEAPVLVRLLFLFADALAFGLEPIAKALMDVRTHFLQEDYQEDCTVVEQFRNLLCDWIELLLGLPLGLLAPSMEPPLTYEQLLIRVRMKKRPEEGATSISLIGIQPG